eukprot:3633785-Karenia_brevis.AAC.1
MHGGDGVVIMIMIMIMIGPVTGMANSPENGPQRNLQPQSLLRHRPVPALAPSGVPGTPALATVPTLMQASGVTGTRAKASPSDSRPSDRSKHKPRGNF